MTNTNPLLDCSNEPEVDFLGFFKLAKDLKTAADTLGPQQARHLVDGYYQVQDARLRIAGQIRSMDKDEKQEPHALLDWLLERFGELENQVKLALDRYTRNHPVGKWARSNMGIGPVTTAGLLAHIDITKAPTVGHIWSFAGLVDGVKWDKGQKRPWNARLKTLTYLIGEGFVKVSNKDDAVYGKLYAERKRLEVQKNDAGAFSAQASSLATTVGKDTEAYAWYNACYPAGATQACIALGDLAARKKYLNEVRLPDGKGLPMLPPGHLHARSRRYAVKLYLAHLHEVMYFLHYGKLPPLPYPVVHLGHAHVINVPNMDMAPGLAEAKR